MDIGIVYNFADKHTYRTDLERICDAESLQTAHVIKKVCEKYGHAITLVNIEEKDPGVLDPLHFIFNLGETVRGCKYKAHEIAKILEKKKKIFTGAPSSCLKSCLNKAEAKRMMVKNNLATPLFDTCFDIKRLKNNLPFPLIVKPVEEDGSIGISSDSVVDNEADLRRKVKEVIDVYKQPALIEEYIEGRELNVAILGKGGHSKALPISEIIYAVPEGTPHILTFEAKWRMDSDIYKKTVNSCPANLPEAIRLRIVDIAVKAAIITNCSGYTRVDFRLQGDQPFVLEINPNPSLSPDSGFIKSCSAAEMDYDKAILQIIELALEK